MGYGGNPPPAIIPSGTYHSSPAIAAILISIPSGGGGSQIPLRLNPSGIYFSQPFVTPIGLNIPSGGGGSLIPVRYTPSGTYFSATQTIPLQLNVPSGGGGSSAPVRLTPSGTYHSQIFVAPIQLNVPSGGGGSELPVRLSPSGRYLSQPATTPLKLNVPSGGGGSEDWFPPIPSGTYYSQPILVPLAWEQILPPRQGSASVFFRVGSGVAYGGYSTATIRSFQIIDRHGAQQTASFDIPFIAADTDDWWNPGWSYRKKLHSPGASGSSYTADKHFLYAELNMQELISLGKMLNGYLDLRVIFTSGSEPVHTNLPYYIASGISPQRIYFPVQNDMPSGIDIGEQADWGYYLYYGNLCTGAHTLLPEGEYLNRNFPQAPYTPTTEWYNHGPAESGFRDKFFYRFNDDPSVGVWHDFADATGFTSGLANTAVTNCITKGHDGRHDTCIRVIDNANAWLKAHDKTGTNIHHPSGNFCLDVWIKPNDVVSDWHAVFTRYVFGGSYHIYAETLTNDWQLRYYYSTVSYIEANASDLFEADQWYHIRFAYRTNWGDDSKMTSYVNGVKVATSPAAQTVTARMSEGGEGNMFIGNESASYPFDGYIEQMRWSTFPEFASGDNRYDVPPDWVTIEHGVELSAEAMSPSAIVCSQNYLGGCVLSRVGSSATVGGAILGGIGYFPFASGVVGGILEAAQGYSSGLVGGGVLGRGELASGEIGGFLYSDAPTHDPGSVGGYIFTESPVAIAYVGGYLNALPLTDREGRLGGCLYALAEESRDDVGGFLIGTWSKPGVSIVDGLARTLVKAHDSIAIAQLFSTDGQFVLYGQGQESFDATVTVSDTTISEFDALLEIIKIRKNPYVEIIDTQISGTGPWSVTITASGHSFDINNNIIVSGVHKADFVWTDGDKTHLSDIAASGGIFSSTHVYESSGIYQPIVMGYDKLSNVGSDQTEVNLASGVGYPYISLSGAPRTGLVPPPLTVDFTIQTSGVLGSHTVYWDYGNGITQYNNSPTTTTQYAMQGDFIPFVVLRDERNVAVVDTLRIGYNR